MIKQITKQIFQQQVAERSLEEKCALLMELLSVNRLVTAEQLERWGLLEAAAHLNLPSLRETVRTQVTQASSLRELTFVARDERWLRRPERDLKHWAGLSELWWMRAPGLGDATWEVLDGRGRAGRRMPDAQVLGLWWAPWAIEVDCGYATQQIQGKLLGMAQAGYRRIVWGTTVHDRVRRMGWMIEDLWLAGALPGVEEYEIRYCNFWSRQDPYENRPRCRKYNEYLFSRAFLLALANDETNDPSDEGEETFDEEYDEDGNPVAYEDDGEQDSDGADSVDVTSAPQTAAPGDLAEAR